MNKKIISLIASVVLMSNLFIGCDFTWKFSDESPSSKVQNENVNMAANKKEDSTADTKDVSKDKEQGSNNKETSGNNKDENKVEGNTKQLNVLSMPQEVVVVDDVTNTDGSYSKKYLYQDAVTISINKVVSSEDNLSKLALASKWQIGETIYNNDLTKKLSYTTSDFSYIQGSDEMSKSGRGIMIEDVDGFDFILDVSVYNDKYNDYAEFINSILNNISIK